MTTAVSTSITIQGLPRLTGGNWLIVIWLAVVETVGVRLTAVGILVVQLERRRGGG